jgi:hypothetical protein
VYGAEKHLTGRSSVHPSVQGRAQQQTATKQLPSNYQATTKQLPSNYQATTKQLPSNYQATTKQHLRRRKGSTAINSGKHLLFKLFRYSSDNRKSVRKNFGNAIS